MNDYERFIASKSQAAAQGGFAPLWMPDSLFDFQRHLVDWSLRKGRASVCADCGLGKTPMSLTWAENVVRKTNGRVLVLAPLAVSSQFVREGEKFGIKVTQCRDGKVLTPFMGIGSEVYGSVLNGRRGIGIELKPAYYRQAVENLSNLADAANNRSADESRSLLDVMEESA